jgi:hypothetical protein
MPGATSGLRATPVRTTRHRASRLTTSTGGATVGVVSKEQYILRLGRFVLGAAVVLVLFIPVDVCLGTECRSRALWEQDSAAGFKVSQVQLSGASHGYRWPLRVGILAIGVAGLAVAYAVATPRREEKR